MLGNPGGRPNLDRVTLNLPTGGYANFIKAWLPLSNTQQPISVVDANGYPNYPVRKLPNNYSAEIPIAADYYGLYTWSWSGRGSMQIADPVIIYSGGAAVVGLGVDSGVVQANTTMLNQASPTLVFKFGALVTGVSGGGGSLVTIAHTSVSFGGGFATGSRIKLGINCSTNLQNGPNSDGSWNITNVDGTHFTLDGSSALTGMSVNASRAVGTNTEAVKGTASVTPYYLSGNNFSSFTNLIFCKTGNYSLVTGGQIYDPVFIAQLQELSGKPGGVGRGGDFWIRYMDVIGVQLSFECDFAQRTTLTSQCYQSSNVQPPAYAAGNIMRSGSDLYTCASNPSGSPSSGHPVDCEIIQGTISATNTGSSPTLTNPRSGFGTWPITFATPMYWTFSGSPASVGTTLQWTFSASWLNGGTPYVFSYVTQASGPHGNDTSSVAIFKANLYTALVSDATFTGKVVFRNSGEILVYPLTPLAGAFSVSSVPAICTVQGSLAPSSIQTGAATFIFNKLMGSFIYLEGGMILAPPLEAIAELSNTLRANVWWNWPNHTKAAYVTAVTDFFANNLDAGLKFGGEFTNEVWNFGLNPWSLLVSYGAALGLNDGGPLSLTSLRTKQYGDLSIAAWAAAGRSASDHHVFNMGQMVASGIGGAYYVYQLNGTELVTTNTTYRDYGGLGGTSVGGSYNASPNRAIDISTAIGLAPYWTSPWWIAYAGNVYGSVSDNAPWLQAAKDYAAGSTTTGITAIINQLNSTTTRTGANNGNFLNYFAANDLGIGYIFQQFEAMAASYDSLRTGRGQAKLGIFHYEGGPQWFPGADFNNGVNEISSANINALAQRMTDLGWNVSSYTTSGTDNKTEMATMAITLVMAVKYSTEYKDMIKTYYYAQLKSISGGNREVHAAQYGYNRSAWGFFPNNYSQGGAFTSYNAFAEYNL